MRVNIYAEEMTGKAEIIKKTSDTGGVYVGVRFLLHSSEMLLHYHYGDDDRSAVTFWFPDRIIDLEAATRHFRIISEMVENEAMKCR